MANDIASIRSAYAFFQGKRPSAGAPSTQATPAPAPQMAQDTYASAMTQMQKRINELETEVKTLRQQASAGWTPGFVPPPPPPPPPVAPQAPQLPTQFDKDLAQFDTQVTQGMDKFNRELVRINQQIGQVNTAIQTQVPNIAGNIAGVVQSFEGLAKAFEGIFK